MLSVLVRFSLISLAVGRVVENIVLFVLLHLITMVRRIVAVHRLRVI